MDETYTYAHLEFKRIDGVWHERNPRHPSPSDWWKTSGYDRLAMLDALHPAPPVQVTLDEYGGCVTYWRDNLVWCYKADNSAVGRPLAVALDRIVELGGADMLAGDHRLASCKPAPRKLVPESDGFDHDEWDEEG